MVVQRMTKVLLKSLAVIQLICLNPGNVWATSGPPPMSTLPPLPPLKKPSQQAQPSAPVLPPSPVVPMAPVTKKATYFHPGVIVLMPDGDWVGGDHLLNITNQISVYVEIIRPPTDKLAVIEEELKGKVEALFRENGIEPVTVVGMEEAALPFYHVQILLYPIDRGYAATIEGRLFESVQLKRFNLDPGMEFQAITWEKTSLIVSPTATTRSDVEKSVLDISKDFTERFKFYEKKKKELLK